MKCSTILQKNHRGVTLVETLVAVIILSIVSLGAIATWSYSEKVPANKRLTEMASYIAVHEIEVVKAQKYLHVADGTTTTYYDKNGIPTAVISNVFYTAVTTVGMPSGVTALNTTADLREIVCVVSDKNATKTYGTERTLIALGGL